MDLFADRFVTPPLAPPLPFARRAVCRCVPATALAPGIARGLVREFLVGLAADPEVRDDLSLAVSELVTNAVKHGADSQPIWVHVLVIDGLVAITVTDMGRAAIWADLRATRVGPHVESGRGLDIVRSLCDDLTVFRGRGTVVRATRRLRTAAVGSD